MNDKEYIPKRLKKGEESIIPASEAKKSIAAAKKIKESKKAKIAEFIKKAIAKRRAKKNIRDAVYALGWWFWRDEYPATYFTQYHRSNFLIVSVTNPVVVEQISPLENKKIEKETVFGVWSIVIEKNTIEVTWNTDNSYLTSRREAGFRHEIEQLGGQMMYRTEQYLEHIKNLPKKKY